MIPKTKFLKLALYNAGSLNTGHDDFLVAMDRFNSDIVAINETWIASGQEAHAPIAPGYRLRNVPRPRHMRGGRGGGVGFYVKRTLSVRFLKHPRSDIEQIWLSTQVNGFRVIVGTAYRPQWLSIDLFLDALTETISGFSSYDYVVLMGDFNVNMLNISNSNVAKINDFLRCLDLEQVVQEPTHVSVNSDTLIDLVCTNCKIREISISNITGSLGHAMVNVSLALKKTKIPPKYVIYRPIKSIDLEKFNVDVNALDWESVSDLSCVEDMIEKFNLLLLTVLDKHAPVVTARDRSNQSLPWITDMIKFMIDLRDKAHDRYRRSRLNSHMQYYKDMKSIVATSINNEKRAFFNHYVNSNVDNSKVFWRNLKRKILLNLEDRHECLPDSFADPNAINSHFLSTPGSGSVPTSQLSYFEHHRFDILTPPFRLQPLTEAEISKYLLSVKSNATGSDGISRDMVLMTLPRTLPVITKIINKSIVTGTVPSQWKTALITPLPKVESPSELKDLRPISILPFLSKILEKAVYSQLSRYVEANNILPTHQSGFRKGRGTVTSLLDVTDNILADQDVGRLTLLTLLDFSRAFECLNIPLLLSKLTYYGCDSEAVKWFNSYLSGRFQAIRLRKVDGSFLTSSPKYVESGVPQGSILGPLLFIIYVADLPSVLKYCKYHCYADDVQLYVSKIPSKISEAVWEMNEDLDRIATWSTNNALVLNPTKSKFMVLGSNKQTTKILGNVVGVNIGGSNIELVHEAKNLGVVFDSRLRFEAHVLSLVRSCFYRLKVLYRIRNFLSEKSRITLCESLILSRLNYGDLVYGPRLLCKTQRLIQRIQNACCRFCFTIPPRTHVSPYINRACMLNMDSRRRLHLAMLMFDLTKSVSPRYLYDKLKFRVRNHLDGLSEQRATRPPLVTHSHKTVAFTGSFRYQATKCWNNIPPPVRLITSRKLFKKHLKLALLEMQKLGLGTSGRLMAVSACEQMS